MEKIFITAQTLLEYSFELAQKIYNSGYTPSILIGIWRGGTPMGIAIQEYFLYKGHNTFHTAVKAESYNEFERKEEVIIRGLKEVIEIVNSEDNMLIIDDIFDSGQTMKQLTESIKKSARKNTPNIKIATLFYKEEMNTTDIIPDFYLKKVNEWIVFPHELVGLTKEEIEAKGLKIEL